MELSSGDPVDLIERLFPMPKTSIKDQNGNIAVIAFHTFIMNSNLAVLIGQPGSYKLNRPATRSMHRRRQESEEK